MTGERETLALEALKRLFDQAFHTARGDAGRARVVSDAWLIDTQLRNHDRHIRATALRDAAEAWATGEWADAFTVRGVKDDESAARTAAEWLLQRADKEEGVTP